MVDFGKLFDLPIIRCHHKEMLCRFALHDPHYTFFTDGRRMDLWITRCFVGREYCDCYDYRSGQEGSCPSCQEGILFDERENAPDERRRGDLLWDEAGGCKFLNYRAAQRYVPKMPNG